MARCPHCAGELASPASCGPCRRPLPIAAGVTPFEILGFEPRYLVDAAELRRRFLAISRDVHPDFFGTANVDLRTLAEQNSARVNESYAILSDEVARADWLVTANGGPAEGAERAMPQGFLLDVLEWNETLEEARASPADARERLEALERTLRGRRDAAQRELRAMLEPLPAHGSAAWTRARGVLDTIRYVDRAASEVESLRLAAASAR